MCSKELSYSKSYLYSTSLVNSQTSCRNIAFWKRQRALDNVRFFHPTGPVQAEVRPCRPHWTWQVLPFVHRTSVQRRDATHSSTRDSTNKSRQHYSVTQSHGNKRPVVLRLHGPTANGGEEKRMSV